MTFARLETFLAPLRAIDWSSWPCQPTGLLGRPMSFGRRYGSVPPEAVPILSLGVDGCHYAVWIDDPRSLTESPGVVRVSPMDSYPDQLRWVAPSIASFATLLRADDDWLLRDDAAIARQREVAEQRRLSVVTVMTGDGLGVVERGTRPIEAPMDAKALQVTLRALVEQGRACDALILARDAIAQRGPQPPGFGIVVASVYEALNRPEYAAVARDSYESSEEQWAMLNQMVQLSLRK